MIQSYRELTVGKYEALARMQKETEGGDSRLLNVRILSILTDKPEDELLNMSVVDIDKLTGKAAFLLTSPRPDPVAKQYAFDRWKLVPVLDIRKMTAAQYIDFQTFAKQPEYRLAEMMSCFLVPAGQKYNNGYDILEVQQAIRDQMPITTALGLQAFFLRKLRRSTLSTLRCSAKTIKKARSRIPEMMEAMKAITAAIHSLNGGGGSPMSTPFLK